MGKDRPLRIFHGPVNIVGIGRYLADWERAHGADADFITYLDHTHRQNSHFNLGIDQFRIRYQLLMKLAFFFYCLIRYKYFHFYFRESLLPFNLDLPLLRLFGKKIIMTYCGSEIRLPEVDQRRNPYSHLVNLDKNHPKYVPRKKLTMRWQRLWVHRIIAVRDLYAYAAEIFPADKIIRDVWVNNTFDIRAYRPESFETRAVPVLVHAPSEPRIKGTEYVERSVRELQEEGYKFEYRLLRGVPNDEAQRIYREETDIIIDQFMLGVFGNLALEGMYAGKPVVGYLLPGIKEEFCPDCPLVNATIDNLKERLAWLIENPAERIRLGREGRAFVERYCDRDKIGQQLWDIYRSL